MGRTIVDVDLDNFHLLPAACVASVFWEIGGADPEPDPRFEKEEWFSSTLLEWGPCGKLVVEGGESLAFAEYAPASLFPRLQDYPASRATSADAAYLAYCFAQPGHRGRGLGTELVRAVARDIVERGYRALEAIGDREWDGTWVLPMPFLAANGFSVVRDHARFPLLRLDLRDADQPAEGHEREAVSLTATD